MCFGLLSHLFVKFRFICLLCLLNIQIWDVFRFQCGYKTFICLFFLSLGYLHFIFHISHQLSQICRVLLPSYVSIVFVLGQLMIEFSPYCYLYIGFFPLSICNLNCSGQCGINFNYFNFIAAIQCLKRKRLYEQQIEQLGNFQLRIHDQVIFDAISDMILDIR